MRKTLWAVVLASTLLGGLAGAEKFSFVAIGDMPYGEMAQFENLVKAVNAARPSFTVHVGDIKSGSSPCTDDYMLKIRDLFNTFAMPLVYTPGDNEWTDCHREKAGKFDPIERLAFVRKTFFPGNQSFGAQKMTLEQESADPRFAKFVENQRWSMGGVTFATVHVVGSNNNLQRNAAAVNEYIERNAANLAWLESTFAKATAEGAKALVLFQQADMMFEETNEDKRSGFTETLALLKKKVKEFGKPVLLVHGDSHSFIVDNPWYSENDGSNLGNFTRLEVYGSARVHGVQVGIDTDTPGVFSFTPIMVPENFAKK